MKSVISRAHVNLKKIPRTFSPRKFIKIEHVTKTYGEAPNQTYSPDDGLLTFKPLQRTSALKNVAMPLLYGTVSAGERLSRSKSMLEKVGLWDKLESTPAK